MITDQCPADATAQLIEKYDTPNLPTVVEPKENVLRVSLILYLTIHNA